MKKDLLFLALIIVVLVMVISGTEIQSVEEYYLIHLDDIQEDSQVVSLSINCSTAIAYWGEIPQRYQEFIPKDGWILEEKKVVLRPKDTAFSILQRLTRHYRIPLDYQGADKNIYGSVYIKGISHLYEFTCGERSGWMYSVNDVFPPMGMSRYELKDGDEIKLLYTCDLGLDLGVKMEAE